MGNGEGVSGLNVVEPYEGILLKTFASIQGLKPLNPNPKHKTLNLKPKP